MKLIEMNMDKIIALCKKYKIAKLGVFGSIRTDRFTDDSDVDLSVIFDSDKIPLLDRADYFFDFIHDLKAVVNREIDMVCDDAVRNSIFRKELDSTKHLIYG